MRGIVAQEECHVDSTHTQTWVEGEADLARNSTHKRGERRRRPSLENHPSPTLHADLRLKALKENSHGALRKTQRERLGLARGGGSRAIEGGQGEWNPALR